MNPIRSGNDSQSKSSEIADLKLLITGIIRKQGNRFIKELLRSKGIRIGSKKADFELNLNEAIETGKFVLEDIDNWLALVEGWGNQHVYIYNISPALQKELTKSRIYKRVIDAGYEEVWDGKTVLEFPDEPKLTSISFKDSILRIVWQESSPGLIPVPEMNYIDDSEEMDVYEYHAYRRIDHRAITRFEAHLDLGLAGLFIAKPIQGIEHKKAVEEAKRVLGLLMDLKKLENEMLKISNVLKNMDQRNIPGSAASEPEVKTQKSRLVSGGAYIEFAANSRDNGYWEDTTVRSIRKSIKKTEFEAFRGTDGVFIFQATSGGKGLSRPLRVQLYGKENRVRLWAQMDTNEVWTILAKLNSYK